MDHAVKYRCPFLKFLRTDITQITVAAFSIVKAVDVIKNIGSSFISGQVSNPIDPFPFHQSRETLHCRIVITDAPGTHSALDPVSIQLVTKVIARILKIL